MAPSWGTMSTFSLDPHDFLVSLLFLYVNSPSFMHVHTLYSFVHCSIQFGTQALITSAHSFTSFKSLLYFCNMATYLISRLLFLYPLEIQEKTTSNLWLIMEKYREAHSDNILSLHSQCLSILMTRCKYFSIIMPLWTIPLLGQHKTWTQR